jgi:hypothetical protein
MSNMGFVIMHQLTLLFPNLRYHPQLGILAGTAMWIRTVLIIERVLIIILSLEPPCDLAVSN